MKYICTLFLGVLYSIVPFSDTFAFSDIDVSWYKTHIQEASERGYIDGYEDGTFRPRIDISREEFLKILFQVTGTQYDENESESCFDDVSSSMWSEKYICTAYELEIARGFEDGTFRPFNEVTVIEALAFISRSLSFAIPQESGAWFENQRTFYSDNNIFSGYNFTRETLLSRGMAMELLLRSQDFQNNSLRDNISDACGSEMTLANSGTIQVGNTERSFILSLPQNYSSERSYPVIFGIHGRTNSNDMVQRYMRLEEYPEGAIVVYPAGLGSGPFTWHQNENIDFFDTLLSYISEKYCINRDKVYVAGHSLGGYFTSRLGCLRGDVIRGISVVGGSGFYGNCKYPVAAQILHRPDDHLVSYIEGEAMLRQFQDVNLCIIDDFHSVRYGGIQHKQFQCSSNNPTLFADSYDTLQNDPHGWPRARNQFIFEFFESLN